MSERSVRAILSHSHPHSKLCDMICITKGTTGLEKTTSILKIVNQIDVLLFNMPEAPEYILSEGECTSAIPQLVNVPRAKIMARYLNAQRVAPRSISRVTAMPRGPKNPLHTYILCLLQYKFIQSWDGSSKTPLFLHSYS